MVFTVAGCLLTNATATGNNTATLNIPYTNEPVNARLLTLPLSIPPGSLIVTVCALRYRMADGQTCAVASFLPASVIDARYC